MGLGRALLLGDLGNWLDAEDNRRRTEFLRKSIHRKRSLDRSQNERLDALELENEELKLYVGMLVELLEDKGVLGRGELAQLARTIEEVDSLEPYEAAGEGAGEDSGQE